MGDDDGSFKRPGAVPFKWEVKPGVPKQALPLLRNHEYGNNDHSSVLHLYNRHHSLPTTPRKLTPPPSETHFTLPSETFRTKSSRSFIWARSDQRDRRVVAQPAVVTTTGSCLLSPLFRRKRTNKKKSKKKSDGDVDKRDGGAQAADQADAKPDGYTSDVGTLTRWSVSARRTLSSLWESASSTSSSTSSVSSRKSSPRSGRNGEWTGFNWDLLSKRSVPA